MKSKRDVLKKRGMMVVAGILVYGYCTGQSGYPSGEDPLCKIIEAERNAHAGKLQPRSLAVFSDYDVRYYRCEWNLNPAVNYIRGAITVHFVPLLAGFDSLQLHLASVLGIDSVKYHGNLTGYSHPADILTVPASLAVQNVLDSVTVYYQGVPFNSGMGSFVQDVHNSVPVIWTLSEPYGASDWWPCKNDLTDKADSMDVIVTCPAGYVGVSNGVITAQGTAGPNVFYHWKHRYPIATYLICVAVTNYAKFTNMVPFGASTVPVDNYVYPEDSATFVTQTPGIIPIMQLYDTLFGLYPFDQEKYGHAQFGWGGGMEHQTMTFMVNFGHELMAHELAHHWFGDKITCGSWEDIWLNEGFATYLSGLTYEHMFNGIWWMPFKNFKIMSITSAPDGSVWCNDTTDVNRIFDGRLTYDKGCMILHQLRWVVGDSVFFTAVNNYLYDATLEFGFARTDQLKSHFEAVYGQSLTGYFNDWFTGEGFPSYQLYYTQAGSTVTVELDQTQSHPSVSFFELPVPVYMSGQGQDTVLVLNHTFSGQIFSISLPFQVDSVVINPQLDIITANNQIILDMREISSPELISIHPNPASQFIHLAWPRMLEVERIEIFDSGGRICISQPAGTQNKAVIGTGALKAGTYILRCCTKDGVVVRLLVINNG